MKSLKWMAAQVSAVALGLTSEMLNGQSVTTATPPADTPYAAVSRDAHDTIWESTYYEAGPNGQWLPHVHRYVETATGLNF